MFFFIFLPFFYKNSARLLMILGIEGVASFFELLDLVSVLADTSFLTYVFDSSLSLIIMETQLSYST